MSGIIVGIDGSVHSRRALEWAIGEAAIRDVPLTVLTVQPDALGYWGYGAFPYPYVQDQGLAERAAKEAQKETDSVLASLSVAPPSVSVQAVTGVPADEILKAAKDADMIVVGSRGAGGFRKLLMGSVSLQVTHHAHCPVMVIPADHA
jgi:nucleotide-binding universal stress UspA family protein